MKTPYPSSRHSGPRAGTHGMWGPIEQPARLLATYQIRGAMTIGTRFQSLYKTVGRTRNRRSFDRGNSHELTQSVRTTW